MSDTRDNIKKNLKKESASQFKGHSWHQGKKPKTEYRCFGLNYEDRYLQRYVLYLRGGMSVSIAYAMLPVIKYRPEGLLYITTELVQVVLSGRGLNILARYLNEERVSWIRESESGMDDGQEDVFIGSIEVKGTLMI